MSKRTLDSFFAPPSKKTKVEPESKPINPPPASSKSAEHHTYPWPIPHLPPSIEEDLSDLVTAQGKPITNQPHLDLLYFQPLIPPPLSTTLFHILRSSLPFYRVTYPITRFGTQVTINTPRYTTVFDVDDTSIWLDGQLFENSSPARPIPRTKYKCTPRPIPECLDLLRRITEAATGESFNFCLVNYYACGSDSISYHSDDEHFLSPQPSIASFSLGAKRDFLLKHKPASRDSKDPYPGTTTIKLPLGSGDMILMRGETQPNWLHSIPKRSDKDKGSGERGRINVTLRKAMVPAGTENYYRYNVGGGDVYRWEKEKKEMVAWKGTGV